ncbi:Phosphomannomutase 1 [Frankliniella fusca]|uniref:Phosphomannomutase 1 n=1 Tax=Frankliniella fusca TaxID=407009 RepID=A0AAE1LSC2_9NEOP|nr:Phosphomannomutase 1 [Frankliniella fusca]
MLRAMPASEDRFSNKRGACRLNAFDSSQLCVLSFSAACTEHDREYQRCAPILGGSMPNTSSSTPFLSSSMSSLRSRRPSACLGGSQGSGLLQQLGTGMVRQFTGSPMGSIGSHMGSGSPQHPGNGRAPSSVPSPPHVRNDILGV